MALGLDYQGVRAGLSQAGIDLSPETWSRVQVIEDAAARALNKRFKR